MSTAEHHILKLTGQKGRLYYFQGNFFHPLTLRHGSIGLVKRGIREFMRDHKAMVASDRAHPNYRTPMELCDSVPA